MYKPDYAPAKTTANGSSRLYDSNFYVMNSDFNVYKCLYNGQTPEYPRGRPSLVEPINWGFDGEYAVTVTSGNAFTVEFPFSQTSSGNVSILPEVRLRSL